MTPLLFVLAVGQTSTSTAPLPAIESIIITASRVSDAAGASPYATTELDIDEILNGRPTLTLGEALAQVPGVFVSSRFNFTQDTRLSIRGFGARSAFGIRGVRILLDGIPLTLPDGQSQVDSIDMAAIGRVGVLRGPAGSLYGNAAGGVLVLSSVEPTDRTEVEVNNVIGAFDLVKTAVTGRTRIDNLGVSLFASRTRFGGWRENATAEQFITMARVIANLSSKVLWTSQLHYVRGPQAQDPGGLTEAEFNDNPRQAAPNNLRFRTGEDLSQIQFGSRLVAQFDAHHRLEVVGHAGVRAFDGNIPFRVIEFARNFYGGQFIYRYQDTFGDIGTRTAVGFELQGQQDKRRNEGNTDGLPNGEVLLNQEEQGTAFGAFVQQKVALFDAFTILGSVRYDRSDFDVVDRLVADGDASGERIFDQLTAQGGALYAFDGGFEAFVNVSQSFETPSFTELVNSAPDGGLSADLEAQKALSIEGGLRGSGSSYAFEASGFWIGLDNELLADEDELNRAIFVNAGESERVGVEVFGRWSPIPELELRAAYSFLRAEFREPERDGRRIPGLPEHRLFGRVRWMKYGFHVAGEVEYVGRRFVDDTNDNDADAYALAELRAGGRFDFGHGLWADLTVGIRNLFDVTYADHVRINGFGGRFFEAGPPLHAYGSLTLGWAQQ